MLTGTVRLVPLGDATAAMVDEALDSVADSLVRSPKLRAAFHVRREAMRAGDLPPALWLLEESGRFIGWCGWVPYAERHGHWQTTTYFAASHRGTGLFDRARCQQIHDMESVRRWEATRDLPPGPFMLSIAAWNERSLRASRRYAADNQWPDTWEQVYEPLAKRDAHLFFFPEPVSAHRCIRPAES